MFVETGKINPHVILQSAKMKDDIQNAKTAYVKSWEMGGPGVTEGINSCLFFKHPKVNFLLPCTFR